MTAPFRADTPQLITGAHRPFLSVLAAHPDWEADLPLDIVAAQISWDEQRAPRVRLALTCHLPALQDDLDALDPRVGVRIEVTAGYVHPNNLTDAFVIADLGLRSRRVTRPRNQLELDASSDEALVIDASAVNTTITAASEPAAIAALLNQAMTPDPTIITTAAGVGAVEVDPVTDLWDTADDLADQIDADLYDDGLRVFHIVPRPIIAGTSSAQFAVGANGTIMGSDTQLSRESWFNAVRLEYEWWTGAGEVYHAITATAQITTGPLSTTAAGVRRFTEARGMPTTQPRANAAAAAVLRRMSSRGRSFQFQAVSALWVRPGMTVTVQLPTGPQERHLVSAVLFDLGSGWMDLTTRLPDNVQTIGE